MSKSNWPPKNPYRIPRAGITFPNMYKGGLFKDEPLFDTHGVHSADIVGGRVVLKSTGVVFSSFTASAKANELTVPYSFSVVRNGFKYWQVMRGGMLISIYDIKEFACRKLEEQMAVSFLDLLNVSGKGAV